MAEGYIVCAIALGTTVLLTPMVGHLARRLGIVDLPAPRKVHRTPVPLLGGLGIYAGAIVALLTSGPSDVSAQVIGVLAGASLLVAVGTLDDLGILHPQVKLMGAMPIAALLAVASGLRVDWPWPSGWSSITATMIWLVGITAAFSILDHLDGLCAGIAALASGFFLHLAVTDHNADAALLAAALLGATVGFLLWNFNPARIFMGDGGAMFLGFALAGLSLLVDVSESAAPTSLIVPALVFCVPVFDTLLVVVSRARRGLIPFAAPGKDHAAHRLVNLGLGIGGAVIALYAVGALSGLLALAARRLTFWASLGLAGAVAIVVLAAIILLEGAPYERQGQRPGASATDEPPVAPVGATPSRTYTP